MNTHADKTQENKSQTVAAETSQMQSGGESTFQFADNRPETVAQMKLQEMANNSPQVSQLRAFQDMANNSPRVNQAAQLQSMADNSSSQQQQPIQKKENNTGLPDNLKTGMENLSGMSLDDVKVHRNSDKPAQLQAHAYAQGSDIHLGSGQEKHLPHEAWHVVQQKQGRVKPTMQMKGKVNVNDDAGLEKEADVMGAKALNNVNHAEVTLDANQKKEVNTAQRVVQRVLNTEEWYPETLKEFINQYNAAPTDSLLTEVETAIEDIKGVDRIDEKLALRKRVKEERENLSPEQGLEQMIETVRQGFKEVYDMQVTKQGQDDNCGLACAINLLKRMGKYKGEQISDLQFKRIIAQITPQETSLNKYRTTGGVQDARQNLIDSAGEALSNIWSNCYEVGGYLESLGHPGATYAEFQGSDLFDKLITASHSSPLGVLVQGHWTVCANATQTSNPGEYELEVLDSWPGSDDVQRGIIVHGGAGLDLSGYHNLQLTGWVVTP